MMMPIFNETNTLNCNDEFNETYLRRSLNCTCASLWSQCSWIHVFCVFIVWQILRRTAPKQKDILSQCIHVARALFHLTPASAAVHVLAICVRKCELASVHTNGQRVRCRLHAIVMCIRVSGKSKCSLWTLDTAIRIWLMLQRHTKEQSM